jgi:membrane-anchored protein YejM (alkaline phosphatase superfamily)
VLGIAWLVAALLTYGVFYLLPAVVPTLLLHFLLKPAPVVRLLRRIRVAPAVPVYGLAVLLAAAVQLLLHADLIILRMYGFHFNGFVWNLLLTPGGLESLGADPSSDRTVALLGLLAVAMESALLFAALRWGRLRAAWERLDTRRYRITSVAVFLGLAAGERLAFAAADIGDYRPILVLAEALPFYKPLLLRHMAHKLGLVDAVRGNSVSTRADSKDLVYPKAPLVPGPSPHDRNIVWLVSESWRFDMLDPEITPETWAFAKGSVRFRNHFSSGNGTRMGIFGMFYGLYGPYWFPFLGERRSPALVDYLLGRGYDIEAYTSARFSYPEFDRTVWVRIPKERLHEETPGLPGWQNDRRNVDDLLASLDRVPAGKPFLRFMFFESPHARYYFPEECAIRKPYLETFDYASADLEKDMPLIKNRYVNSCRHLDTQFARVFKGLEERKLLDNTVVIVTGDHGEAFMERGRWGHHSSFDRFQTQVPLILRAPGVPPAEVDRMTSHLDIPATILGLLGVANPPSDYSLGLDLLGPETRNQTVLSGWDDLAVRGPDATVSIPMGRQRLAGAVVLDADDRTLEPDAADRMFRESGGRIQSVLDGLGRFRK